MEIHKMKILIYVLTFLGYAWSGYGAGVVTNLRDAILAAEHVFGDILENVVSVIKQWKNLTELVRPADEECIFTCPNGQSFGEFRKCIICCERGSYIAQNKYVICNKKFHMHICVLFHQCCLSLQPRNHCYHGGQ